MIEKDVDQLEIDPLAELNPKMTDKMFQVLFDDIQENGMREPITIVDDNKIIDGRHRWLVHKELGLDKIKCIDRSELSKSEREEFVYSTERRRHQTPTQLAIAAWNYYIKVKASGEKITMAKAAEHFGSSLAQVKRANKIGGTAKNQFKRPDILELLFNSQKFSISPDPTNPFETDSLYSIEEYLIKQKKALEKAAAGKAKNKKQFELTDEEEDKVVEVMILLKRESAIVRETIARRLYAYNLNQ